MCTSLKSVKTSYDRQGIPVVYIIFAIRYYSNTVNITAWYFIITNRTSLLLIGFVVLFQSLIYANLKIKDTIR